MKNSRTNMVSLLYLIIVFSVAQSAQANEWDDAERQILYLKGDQFNHLPENIIEDLEKKNCTVPQTYSDDKSHNVISGEFAKAGQTDWAVLCSNNQSSKIIIFWGGSSNCPPEIEESKDRSWLQGIGGGRIGYSRKISPANKDYIMSAYDFFGGPKPPLITHQGIDNAFIEKGSEVLYCYEGKWLRLQGAD